VMERLKHLDRVAYIRYASVYRDFNDIESFEQAVKDLRDGNPQLPLPQIGAGHVRPARRRNLRLVAQGRPRQGGARGHTAGGPPAKSGATGIAQGGIVHE
jgi:hypothetical protein